MSGRQEAGTPLAAYKDLFQMSLGMFDADTWQQRWYTLEDLPQMDDFFFRHRHYPEILEKAFVIEPFDYTGKKIMVKTTSGEVHAIKAELKLEEHSRQYILFTPKS